MDLSLIKRGDLMVAARWDVTDPENQSKQLFRHIKYDTAGNAIASFDELLKLAPGILNGGYGGDSQEHHFVAHQFRQ